MDILDNPWAPSGVYLCVIITHPIWRFLTKEKIRATFREGRAGGIIGGFIVLLSSSCIIVLLSIIEHCWRNRCTSPQFCVLDLSIVFLITCLDINPRNSFENILYSI